MVRAILAGQKTQTRRVVTSPRRPPSDDWFISPLGDDRMWPHERIPEARTKSRPMRCPYGQPGDRLWVRETWAAADIFYQDHELDEPGVIAYRADKTAQFQNPGRHQSGQVPDTDLAQWNWDLLHWRPSIHMPRWASRITLEVTGLRVERLHDISEADALAEGVTQRNEVCVNNHGQTFTERMTAKRAFQVLWHDINGAESWDANPWVWVVEFRRVL